MVSLYLRVESMKDKLLKLAAFCCAVTLSACGGRTNKTVTAPDGKLDPCTIRFSWWGGDDRHEATLEAIKLWNSRHPEIVITPEYGGWDGWTEKTAAQIGGGTAPDIMQINYDWLVTLSPDGKGFYDLDRLADQLDLSGFDEDVLSFGRVNGLLNAVTVSVCGRGPFYNSQTYESLGASFPETWDDLLSLGETMRGSDKYPIDLDIQSGFTAWYLSVVYIQQKTGRNLITMDGELGFTVEDIEAALDFYKSLEDSHAVRTVKEHTDQDGNSALYQSSEFISGRVAGVLEWGSSVGKYEMVLPEGALKAGPLLADESGNNSGWMIKPSLLYAISANTEHPDEAAAFMDFMLNDSECAEILGTTRGIPSSEYAEKSLENSEKLEGLVLENHEMLEAADTVTISPYMELDRMKEFYNTAIEKVSYGTEDTHTAAQEMYDAMSSYLEKIRK